MILTVDIERGMSSLAMVMKHNAERGYYRGVIQTARERRYFMSCRRVDEPTGTILIFSRDIGHHTGGWFKNPDYERCYHLSLSFFDPVTGDRIDQDKGLARSWCALFFGQDRDLLWCEPPYSAEGKANSVWHYRLFCDPGWQAIMPRGEVYSREFTERGWKSFSDIHGYRANESEFAWGGIKGEAT